MLAAAILASYAGFHVNAATMHNETEPAPSGTTLTPEKLAALDTIDIPVLHFTLTDGKFPDFECVMPPEGCIGTSITNNEWVEGELIITRKGEVIYESGKYESKKSGIRLKARGNGSSNEGGHKAKRPSYKIKLQKKANILIGDTTVSKSKDWVLLKDWYSHLSNAAGYEVGRLLGLGWQPRGYSVVLMINGNYFGCYYLIEAIAADKNRINISDTGFVIEDDVYWWTPDEKYFKTDHLHPAMGWTFKEPDADDVPDSTLNAIADATRDFENALYAGPDSIPMPLGDMMDIKSVAAWTLAHDIMNNQDGCGSNIYVVKDDLDPENPYKTKFRMGPLWDLDGTFLMQTDAFAPVHSADIYWCKQLFYYPEFCEAYKELWASVKDTFHDDIMKALDARLKLMPGLDDAWKFAGSSLTKQSAVKYIDDFLTQRLPVLDKLISNMAVSGVDKVAVSTQIPAAIPADGGAEWLRENKAMVYGLDGTRRITLCKGINIIRFPDGSSVKRAY